MPEANVFSQQLLRKLHLYFVEAALFENFSLLANPIRCFVFLPCSKNLWNLVLF